MFLRVTHDNHASGEEFGQCDAWDVGPAGELHLIHKSGATYLTLAPGKWSRVDRVLVPGEEWEDVNPQEVDFTLQGESRPAPPYATGSFLTSPLQQ